VNWFQKQLLLKRHPRERGDPGVIRYSEPLDSCLRRNDRRISSKFFASLSGKQNLQPLSHLDSDSFKL
jgi:hypothetical protein